MSFFSALLDAAGGYGAGRQQRTQNQQQQEIIDAQKAEALQRAQIEGAQEKRAEDTYSRSIGIDPATGKPVTLPSSLTQVSPNNKGRVPMTKDPITGKPTIDQTAIAQQQIDHLYAVANNYVQRGYPELAQPYIYRAQALEGIVKSTQAQAALNARDIFNQGQQDQRTGEIIAGANQRNENSTNAALNRTLDIIQGENTRNIRTTDTSRGNAQLRANTSLAETGARIAEQYTAQSSNDLRQMAHDRAVAIKDGKTDPYPGLDKFNAGLSYAIGVVAKDPKKLSAMLKNIDSNAGLYNPQMVLYAKRQLQNVAREAEGEARAQQNGGSDASLNPPETFLNP